MKNAIVFTRHQLTEAQKAEIMNLGFEFFSSKDSFLQINDSSTAQAVYDRLRESARQLNARAIFGVFPAPLRELIHRDAEMLLVTRGDYVHPVCLYEAWNVRRTKPGGPPTFEHLKWCRTGAMEIGIS